MPTLGERLRKCRRARELTQAELGRLLGLSKQTVSGYEAGLRNPDPDTLQRLADIFGVSTDYLLGRTDTPQLPDPAPRGKPGGESLGQRLRALREKANLNQIELAKQLGVANSTISQYEADRRIPDLPTLQKLATILGVPLGYLVQAMLPGALIDTHYGVAETSMPYGLKEVEIAPGTKAFIPQDANLTDEDVQLIRDIIETRRKRREEEGGKGI